MCVRVCTESEEKAVYSYKSRVRVQQERCMPSNQRDTDDGYFFLGWPILRRWRPQVANVIYSGLQ